LERGVNPLLPTDLALLDTKTNFTSSDLEVCDGFYGKLVRNLRLYQRLATDLSTRERQISSQRLNSSGTSPQSYKVGDIVKIYAPHGNDPKRRAKHQIAWRGPCTITKRTSNTGYEMREKQSGKIFGRTIANIGEYPKQPSGAVSIEEKQLRPVSSRQKGSHIIVRDSEDAKAWWIGEFLNYEEDELKLHYYGTQNSKVDEARFRPVWISERDGKSILGNKRAGDSKLGPVS